LAPGADTHHPVGDEDAQATSEADLARRELGDHSYGLPLRRRRGCIRV
jgi:hypothetical protein